jgi:hypothetical protein
MPTAATAVVVALPYPWLASDDVWITVHVRGPVTDILVKPTRRRLFHGKLATLVGVGKLVGGFVVSPGPGGPPGVPLLRKETPQ